MNLLWKLKLELHIFQQYFTPLKQGESKTTMGPKQNPSYSHVQQFPSVNVFNRTDTQRNMPIVDSNQHSLFPKATAGTRSPALAT